MALAFVMLALGGILLGGAWSFHTHRKPLWSVIVLAVAALACIVVALWRINQ
ncbi:hypothetical protein JSY14_03475 [Brachybacterium sp. EF45031]|uniref:hypothetical protein n=1 Tax=Brachybacterium sillae TaxID=2810536 RepID=UPI00217F0C85|nr:hypothetical protein [Brachybacterium sillae]MCS6711118.1 hypothetical protein [Brachybacterium sillae]